MLLAGLVAYTVFNLLKRSDYLRQQIDERTHELSVANQELEREISERKHIDKILRESEKRFRTLIESAASVIIMLSPEQKLLEFNKQAERLYGVSREEVLGKNYFELFIPPEVREYVIADMKKVLAGEITRAFENPVVTKEGEERTLVWAGSRLLDDDGNPYAVMAVGQDITERKRAEEQLRASEENLRLLIQSSEDCICQIDLGGKYINMSRAGIEINQIENPGRIPGMDVTRDVVENKPALEEALNKAVKGETTTIQYKTITEKGREIWWDARVTPVKNPDGGVISVLKISRDITRRKAREQALSRAKELGDALNRISGLISSTFELDTILKSVVREARRAIGCDSASIIMKEGSQWVVRYAAGFSEKFLDQRITSEQMKAMASVLKIDRPYVSNNSAATDKNLSKELIKGLQIKSVMFQKLKIKKDIIGVLCFSYSSSEGEFLDAEIDFSNKLTASTSQAIESARLYMAERIASRDIEEAKNMSDALNNIAAAISSTLEFSEIMQRVTVQSAKAIGSESAMILLREHGQWRARYLYKAHPDLVNARFTDDEARTTALTVKSKVPIIINDAFNNKLVNQEIMHKYEMRSILTVPLIVKDEALGTLFFYNHSAATPFTQAQADFALKLSTSISLALENARLYQTERNIAHTLQNALLAIPDHIDGIEFGHLYRSATEAAEVGGDFYDLFELEHKRVGLLMGDVSGKGLEAAALTSVVKNTIKAFAFQGDDAATVMRKTNSVLLRTSSSSVFVTLFFGILDLESGKLFYCSAGHPPAIIKSSGGDTTQLIPGSPAIGVSDQLTFYNDSHLLKNDDLLVLYTDGVIESRTEGTFFGEEGLLDFLKQEDVKSASDAPQQVFDRIFEFTNGLLTDDIGILAIARKK